MKRILARLDALQQRRRALALPVAVAKRFGEHQGGRLAAVFSYYSFFSVFPLLLALVTIVGLVLEDRPDLRDELVEGAMGQIPVIGSQLTDTQQPLGGDIATLVIGLAAALWAGMGAIGALQAALDEIWDVPPYRRANFVLKRLRTAAVLVVIALGIAASTLLANLATLFDVGDAGAAFGVLATVAIDAVLLVVMFGLLTSVAVPWRQQLPGAIAGGVALVALNQAGSFVIRRFIAGADDTYGTFAIVIALLSWFFLLGRVLLLAAEVSAVAARDLTPRSLFPGSELTDADRRAVLLDAQRIQRDTRVGYATSIDGHVASGPPADTTAAAAGSKDPADAAGSTQDVEVAGEPADLEQPLHGRAR